MVGWHYLRVILSPDWLKSVSSHFLQALKLFFLPALFFALASIGIHFANSTAMAQLNQRSVDLPDLMKAIAIFLAAAVLGVPFLLFALVKWMYAISVFTQYWLDGPFTEPSESAFLERKTRAQAAVNHRQKYLTGYWFYCSLFALGAIFGGAFIFGIKVLSMVRPDLLSTPLPFVVDFILLPVGALFLAFALVISLVAVPVSAFPIISARQGAHKAFVLSLKYFLPTLLCAVFFGGLHAVVDNPRLLFEAGAWKVLFNSANSLPEIIGVELWQGLTSVLFVPLSLVPLCEMLRGEFTTA